MLGKIQDMFAGFSKNQLIMMVVAIVLALGLVSYYAYRCMYPSLEKFVSEDFGDGDGDGDGSEHFENEEAMMNAAAQAAQTEAFNDVHESFENNTCALRMFYVDWCGFCKEAKPKFKQFMSEHNGKTFGGKKLVVELVNAEQEKEKTSSFTDAGGKAMVESYPTVIFTKNGQHTKYNGEREASAFAQFVQQNCK
jgi:thiol-disulfide isomerase/thioredoxin